MANTVQRYAYQVFSPGETASIHSNYGDAQREAWKTLRRAGLGAIASIRVMCSDGQFREMEYWTLGSSGKFRWHQCDNTGLASRDDINRAG
jgi:hypothetical protein